MTTAPAAGDHYFLVRPRDWDHMPWLARDRWERRHVAALRALRTEQGACGSWGPPTDLPPSPIDYCAELIDYDDQGRRIWSPEQMRAAVRADRRARSGGRPMTNDEVDALCAHRRLQYRRRADAALAAAFQADTENASATSSRSTTD